MNLLNEKVLLVLLRLGMGSIFLWAFFDKLLGLGFATAADKSWLLGNSPTTGFLKFATSGIFKTYFESLAGNPLVDWLFMIGLLMLGVSLILGIGMRIAAIAGSTLMILMWLSNFPPANNPILDDHLIYLLVLLLLATKKAGNISGFGKSWSKTEIVKRNPILE